MPITSPRRVVLVHGFTQTATSWTTLGSMLRDRLRPEPEVIATDVPGHGTRSDVHVDLVEAARLLAAEHDRAAYVGYSLGGRLCLHLALERPELVERLVLIGASPGIADADERARRRAADEALADELERIGVDAFLERWLAQPLFADLQPGAADLAARRTNTAAGLAASLRLAGTGHQASLWDRLAEITAPVLVLAGERDTKFVDIGRRMVDRLPAGELRTIPDAGHAAHLERPVRTGETIIGWLSTPR